MFVYRVSGDKKFYCKNNEEKKRKTNERTREFEIKNKIIEYKHTSKCDSF